MPLIHDNPWLIEQLLKAAQTPPPPPIEAPTVANQQQVVDALHALLGNLKKQITPSSSGVQHGAGDSSVDLAATHMESMGDFVAWLNSNKTIIDGVQIVYSGNAPRPSNDYGYYRVEPGTDTAVKIDDKSVRPTVANKTDVRYWINTEALKKYLGTLQADPSLKKNTTFQLQLLHLVRFANEQLDVDINETYKEETPDQEVDRLPQTLDMKQWAQPGTKALWLHDLKDINTLNAWFGSNPMTAVKVGNHPPQTMRDQHWNRCAAVNVLSARARSLQNNAVPESKARATAYVTVIGAIAKSINCQISANSDVWGDESRGSDENGEQSEAAMSSEQLAGLLPFNTNFIDFRPILTFVNSYAAIRPQMSQLATQVRDATTRINSMLNAPGAPIQMQNLDGQRLGLLAKNAGWGPILVRNLYTLISISGRMYQDFMVFFAQNHGGMDGSAVRPLRQQIGVQQQNMNDLMRVINQLGTQRK
jgi:hypothetical protein